MSPYTAMDEIREAIRQEREKLYLDTIYLLNCHDSRLETVLPAHRGRVVLMLAQGMAVEQILPMIRP